MDKINKTDGTRVFYIDALRVFSVFCMIMLHVAVTRKSNGQFGETGWMVANVFDCFARFCVPVFVMVSGLMFLNPDKPVSIKAIYTKYLLRIATAFAFWSLLYAVPGSGNFRDLFFNFIHGGGHMWFLYMLCGLYMTTPLLRKITEDKKLTEYFLLLAFVFALMTPFADLFFANQPFKTRIVGKMHLQMVLGYQFYYVVGFYLGKYGLRRRHEITVFALGAIGFLFMVAGTRHMAIKNADAYTHCYAHLLPGTAFYTMAVFMAFKNTRLKLNAKAKNAVSLLAKLSFGIYLVHLFVLRQMLADVWANPAVDIPYKTIVVFTASAVIVFVISKIPVLNKYIM